MGAEVAAKFYVVFFLNLWIVWFVVLDRQTKIFLHFWRTSVLFVGVTEQLFWNSGDVCHGFQSVESLACVLCRLHATGSQTLKATYQTPPTSGSGFYACKWQCAGPDRYKTLRRSICASQKEEGCRTAGTYWRTQGVHCDTEQWLHLNSLMSCHFNHLNKQTNKELLSVKPISFLSSFFGDWGGRTLNQKKFKPLNIFLK